jgi:hypothetical protein
MKRVKLNFWIDIMMLFSSLGTTISGFILWVAPPPSGPPLPLAGRLRAEALSYLSH